MYVEVRKNNKWEKVGQVFKGWKEGILSDQPYHGRNYDLFAILANVRNGRGFAGIKTGEGFNPISEPKGLPEDVSPEVKQSSDDWDVDGHSHSWHTVADLINYNWHQETISYGEKGKYFEFCEDFLDNTVPSLEELGVELPGRASDVRIVFWFDN